MFLDALLALFIGTVALAAALAGLAQAAHAGAQARARALGIVEERNIRAEARPVRFATGR